MRLKKEEQVLFLSQLLNAARKRFELCPVIVNRGAGS